MPLRPSQRWRRFNICLACHTIGPGAQNKVGPELNGLNGRKAGTVPNFDYSDANKSSGIVWNEETFEDYIKNPAAKVPGTKMIFPGIRNEQQVKDRSSRALGTSNRSKTYGLTSANSTPTAMLKSNAVEGT